MALDAGPENLLSTQAGNRVTPPDPEPPPLNPPFPYARVPFDAALFGADKPAPLPPPLLPVDNAAKG